MGFRGEMFQASPNRDNIGALTIRLGLSLDMGWGPRFLWYTIKAPTFLPFAVRPEPWAGEAHSSCHGGPGHGFALMTGFRG